MKAKKTNILIVGAGRGGCALLEMFANNSSVNVIGIVDKSLRAPGIKLAKKLGIPFAKDWKKFAKEHCLNEIIDVTGSKEGFQALLKEKPKKVDLVGGPTAKMLWVLVSERARAEEALKLSAGEWGRTFNAISDFVFIQDKSYIIIKANRALAEALKMKVEDIVGKKCYEALHGLHKPWPQCPFEESKKDYKSHVLEVDDPKIGVPLLVTVSPILDDQGKFLGSVHIAKDISDIKGQQKELEKIQADMEIQTWGLDKTNQAIKLLYKELEEKNRRLQELDRLKSEFVSTVSHELRTPLAITKEGISLILDEIPGEINDKQGKILTTARNNIDRLGRIISNLLDISKMEAGKMKLKRELINVKSLVQQVVASFQLKVEERGLELKISLPRQKLDVYVDPDRVIQVFTNLIYNAIKFTEKGFIKVGIENKENELECSVADTGGGIDAQNLPQMFNKFQQFGRLAGAGEKGTGLGLSIAKEIVHLHKGEIWVDSPYLRTKDNFDRGTIFSFSLPKYTAKDLLQECLVSAIQTAQDKDSQLSLIIVSLAELEQLRNNFSDAEIRSLLKILEEVLRGTLRREEDIALEVDGRIVILVSECDKENALRVRGRFRKTVFDYLALQKLDKRVALKFDTVTFPDEARNVDELMQKSSEG